METAVIACQVEVVGQCLMTVAQSRDMCGARLFCSTWYIFGVLYALRVVRYL